MDELEPTIGRRRDLWRARDQATDLQQRVDDLAAGITGDTPPIEVAGDDPDALLEQARRSLDEVERRSDEIDRLEEQIARTEEQIQAFEHAAARRRQQLIGLVVLAVVIAAVITVALLG